MLQFYAEMERNQIRRHVIPSVDTAYFSIDGRTRPGHGRIATLYGDVDGDGQGEWVVGCYQLAAAKGHTGDDRAHVVVFKRETSGRWRFSWRSPGLGFSFHAPDYNLREVDDAIDSAEHLLPSLALVDIDGDRRLEIAYTCWSQSESLGALPGILRWDGGKWSSIAPRGDRFSLRDLDGDGKLETLTGSRFVGDGTGDNDVPRVWRWDGRQYIEASAQFKKFYADLAQRYRDYINRMRSMDVDWKKNVWERAYQKAVTLAS